MKNDKKTLIKGIILIMLVAVIGTTYAYFAANITGNESTSTIVVTGGTMEIVYDNLSGTIEAYDIYPREDAWVTKNFTVTGNNSTTKDMKYKLALKVDKNTFSSGEITESAEGLITIPSALTYTLTSVNTSNKGTIVGTQTNQSINLSEITLGTGSFPKGEDMVHTYTFELFFKDTGENQNDDQGKEFAAHIIIEESPFNEIALSASNLSSIGYTDGTVPSSLVIPEKYQDTNGEWNQVTLIADLAFIEGTIEDLESLVPLPSLNNLTSLTLNEGLESIGIFAFAMATNLTGTITIPSSVKTIGYGAFMGTGITGLTLNEGLESIGIGSFSDATNLTGTLTIPSTVKTIGEQAFSYTGITGLTLNEGIENIGESAFDGTTNLTGVLTIPSTVKTIGEGAFFQTGITGLTLNEGLESIGYLAFYETNNLTGTLTIPSTVKTIGWSAFQNTGITGLTLNEGLESIGNNAFIDASNLTGTITIPSTVTSIGESAFQYTGITGLTLNEGLESIGKSAFYETTNLTGTLTIPSTVKTIGSWAFSNTGITTINYRGSEEQWNQISIGTDAFPDGVTINYNYTSA